MLKKYSEKYKPKGYEKGHKFLNNPFWMNVIKDTCKEDFCNVKCKYTKSRKNVFNKIKKKLPLLSYCKKSEAIEKMYMNKNSTKRKKN